MPRNTSTSINDSQGNNRTASHLSTNIIVVVDGNTVGAVQQLQVTESRPEIKMIDELGTDGHIDSAPSRSTNITLTIKRVRFDRMRIAEAFSRGYVHVHAQRLPFDIEIHDRFHDGDPQNAIITVIKNVWIRQISYVYQVSDFVIMEDMSCDAERIFSVINTDRNVGQATANGREQDIVLNPFEQEADRGLFSGSLDGPGLLNAMLDD